MPITVHYNNDSQHLCTIRPTPLISVNSNILKNGAGESFGVTYTITLNGKLLASEGTPYAFKSNNNDRLFKVYKGNTAEEISTSKLVGPYHSFDNTISHDRPQKQQISDDEALGAILSKQKSLRALFAMDGQRVEITDWAGLNEQATEHQLNPVMIFYPRVTSIAFQEGAYVDTCDYSITMEADVLLSNSQNDTDAKDFQVDIDAALLMATSGLYNVSGVYGREKLAEDFSIETNYSDGERIELITEQDLKNINQSYIEDFSEEWSIEADEQFGENFGDVPLYSNVLNTPFRDLIQPKSYIVRHTLSANGKTHYGPHGKSEAWKEAKNFVENRLVNDVSKHAAVSGYPSLPGFFGSGALNLANYYNGFNHSRNEDVNISNGSYSITETWLIASGTDYENYNMSITSDNQNPFVNVSIQGQIKGLSSLVPSSVYYGGQYQDQSLIQNSSKRDPRFLISPYMNALEKWYNISKNGAFGYKSDLYRRANSVVAVELNSQPLDISLGMNEYTGEIDYSLSFDNRPTNIISGVLFENININETYPGDVYSLIPVIGRKTGPVLQYNGSRTEYSRDLNIELVMDSTKIPYDTGRRMLQRRPSAVNPTASQLESLIHELSPQYEPGIRKYFHDPPQESWNPKTGQYSFSIRWIYELDK